MGGGCSAAVRSDFAAQEVEKREALEGTAGRFSYAQGAARVRLGAHLDQQKALAAAESLQDYHRGREGHLSA